MSDVPRTGLEPVDDEPREPADLLEQEPLEPDEPELDEQEPEEPQEQPQPDQQQQQQRRSRPGEATRWRQRAEQAEREAAELRGYRQALEQTRQQAQVQQDPNAVLRQLQERWSQMDPAAAMIEALQFGEQRSQQAMLNQYVGMQDRIDRQAYEQEIRRGSALHRQYQAEVERELQARRARGIMDDTRESILERLYGRDAMARATRAAPRQRREAAARVAGQTTQPANGRGDVPRGRAQQTQDEADEALLRSIRPEDL